MYASKTPRDLNHDPKPHENGHGSRQDHPTIGGMCGGCITRHVPRSSYDHKQHNEPNPILVEFREEVEQWSFVHKADLALNRLDYMDALGLTYDEDPQVDHACKVLTRLARLAANA